MPGTNQFLPFATGVGANTLTPTAYAALTAVIDQGFQPGLAKSQQANTVWRQATFVAAAVAQLIANDGGNANDDGNLTAFVTSLTTAIKNTFVPTGTRMLFAQAAAPTGWTQDTTDTADNRMMRVVNTAGGGVGGSEDPTIMNVVPYHTHGFTTGGMSSNNPHSHSVYDPGHAHGFPNTAIAQGNSGQQGRTDGNQASAMGSTNGAVTGTGILNADINHSHSGGTDGGSSQQNWTPRYVNLIICAKN